MKMKKELEALKSPFYLMESTVPTRRMSDPAIVTVSSTIPEPIKPSLPPLPKTKGWSFPKFGLSRKTVPEPDSKSVENGELQAVATTEPPKTTGICLLRDSPFRILRAAESGNLDEFKRLYHGNNSRLTVQDNKGRTCAHQAAARNRINILQFIKEQNGNIDDIQDTAGNTPLHVAVEHGSLEAIDFLLDSNVQTGILNEKKQAPVHLATELNKVKALQVMGKHRQIFDIQKGGEHGRTALHIAAIYDHEECARILITEFDACPRKPCNNGYYPIHEAAKNASSKTMEVFFQWGENRGCTREEMISFYDSEGNVPLHSAVHGGDIKAVELCINSGAKLSTQQHDLSTPVHLACAQGALEIVKLMFIMQPNEKKTCLMCVDAQKMTPLHCASMFDHPDIVEYLVSEGADINALDKERRTPLLLAASRGGWKTVHVLIRLGANISIKDVNHRNVLHLVIMNGGRLCEFAEEVSKAQSKSKLLHMLNEKDHTGCSPLHFASREGHIKSLENLIRLGAVINLKNNNNESPLHFAAQYGRYNTVRQLIDSEKGAFIINESDGNGLTPLHISSKHGHTRVVQLLLNRGALLHRDHNGRNPIHLASMSGYTQTIELLHSVHSHLLDQVDKDGNTPLHLATMENKQGAISLLLSMGCKLLFNYLQMSAIDYAIHYKYQEAALAMVTHDERCAEVMNLRSDKHPCVTLALISAMPRVFEAVQDKCITRANCKKDSKSFYISYSFSCLQCPSMYAQVDERTGETVQISKPIPLPALNMKYSFMAYQKSPEDIRQIQKAMNNPNWRPQPLHVVNAMVSHGRVELLAHPLSQKYLQMKWNSYGKYFHIFNLFIYCVFLFFVTIYSSQMTTATIDTTSNVSSNSNNESLADNLSRHTIPLYDYFIMTTPPATSICHEIEISNFMVISAIAISVYIFVNILRELVAIYQQKMNYLLESNHLISWLLYISSLIMVLPVFQRGNITDLHFSAASMAVFLSWFNLLLFLQRFDQIGIYVVMFLEILETLMKVLMVFSILIIAFGLSFYILMSKSASGSSVQKSRHQLPFYTIPMSLIRTFSMMLGEMNFVETYVDSYYLGKLTFPMPSFILLGLFMVLMPILLMNLLIGLAVGDIESVRRNAQLKRLAMQVVLHTNLELKLPQVWLERVDKMELIEYPNNLKCKLGFFDFIIRKWFCNPFSDDGTDVIMETSNDDFLSEELEKQKRKLKDISNSLDNQHQLLRLIIQKMEIKTEADDVDEGVSPNEVKLSGVGSSSSLSMTSPSSAGASRWNSPKIKSKLKHGLSFTKP